MCDVSSQSRGEAFSISNSDKLRVALTAPFMTLFHRISRAEGGVKFMVELRQDILVSGDRLIAENRAKSDPANCTRR